MFSLPEMLRRREVCTVDREKAKQWGNSPKEHGPYADSEASRAAPVWPESNIKVWAHPQTQDTDTQRWPPTKHPQDMQASPVAAAVPSEMKPSTLEESS